VCVLLIRATIRVASLTLPIWSMWMAWKLLVHLMVITVWLSWWWTWRVEGLLIVHLLCVIVVILTSIIWKLVLIYLWQSNLQSINAINDSTHGAFHQLKSCVGGLLVLCEQLSQHLYHGTDLFVANTFFLFVSRWWWWWWRVYLFWWNGKRKIESNTTSYRLVKTNCKTEGGSTHSLKHLTPLLRVFNLHFRWQPVVV
jgi:hypothetical protein